MPLLTLCFQLHQPFRLHPEGTALFWDEKNREIFTQRAERCYLPTIQMFSDLVRAHYDFKISLSISGTFIEQAELYQPQVLDAAQGAAPSRRRHPPGRVPRTALLLLVRLLLRRSPQDRVQGTGLAAPPEDARHLRGQADRLRQHRPVVQQRDRQHRGGHGLQGHPLRADGQDGRRAKPRAHPGQRGPPRDRAKGPAPQAGRAAAKRGLEPQAGPRTSTATPPRPASTPTWSTRPAARSWCSSATSRSWRPGRPHTRRWSAFWRNLAEEITSRTDIVPANPTEIAEWFQITECPMVDCPDPTDSLPETMSGQAGHAAVPRPVGALPEHREPGGRGQTRRRRPRPQVPVPDHLGPPAVPARRRQRPGPRSPTRSTPTTRWRPRRMP